MKIKKYLVRASIAAGTLGVIVAGAAAFSAFEAHIVNVTARIENAMSVSPGSLAFGTVFPQEYLLKDVTVVLSDSFVGSTATGLNYTIKQKPKVKDPVLSCTNQQVCDYNLNPVPGDPYATITVDNFIGPAWQYCESNLPPDSNLTDNINYTVNLADPYWQHCFLPLADDLSKDPSVQETGDVGVPAFHHAYTWVGAPSAPVLPSSLNPAAIASGTLTNGTDPSDTWTIDLKTPCFYKQCAQEAFDQNNAINDATPGFFVPTDFMLDPATEHKVFGTDLWIEVTGITRPPQ